MSFHVSEGGLEGLLPSPRRCHRWPRALATSGMTSLKPAHCGRLAARPNGARPHKSATAFPTSRPPAQQPNGAFEFSGPSPAGQGEHLGLTQVSPDPRPERLTPTGDEASSTCRKVQNDASHEQQAPRLNRSWPTRRRLLFQLWLDYVAPSKRQHGIHHRLVMVGSDGVHDSRPPAPNRWSCSPQ
jgi:hypothetical protein